MPTALELRLDAPVEREATRLYEEHSAQLLGYCLRQLRSRSDAEDAVQTTFLYAFRALRRGVAPESEIAWLMAIAKNVCLWQKRTAARRGFAAAELDPEQVGAAPQIGQAATSRDFREALEAVPELQRRALVLREWHGLSSREVAAQLGMETGATYALLTRARRSLAAALVSLPRSTALGLATLLYELRANVKALFVGGTAKAAGATVVAAAVTVGGVSARGAFQERDRGRNEAAAAQVTPTPAAQRHPDASRAKTLPVAGAVLSAPSRAAPDLVAPPASGLQQTQLDPAPGAVEPVPSTPAAGNGPPTQAADPRLASAQPPAEDELPLALDDFPLPLEDPSLPVDDLPLPVDDPPVAVDDLVPPNEEPPRPTEDSLGLPAPDAPVSGDTQTPSPDGAPPSGDATPSSSTSAQSASSTTQGSAPAPDTSSPAPDASPPAPELPPPPPAEDPPPPSQDPSLLDTILELVGSLPGLGP